MKQQRSQRLSLLPLRPKGSYSSKFNSINISTNHYHVRVRDFELINIFAIRFEPMIPFENVVLRRKTLEAGIHLIKEYIPNPVLSGNNVYSFQPYVHPQQNFEISVSEYRVLIKKVKVLNVKQNPHLLLSFLNNGLRTIMRKLGYVQIGNNGKYFNTSDKKPIDNLIMFNGYRSNFVSLENGFYLRIDSAKKIVQNTTVLEEIDRLYRIHQDKSKQEKRILIQSELQGKIVMTNYGKTAYYKIEELCFDDLEDIKLDGLDGTSIPLKQYYSDKYGITIKKPKQPLLKVQSKRRNAQFSIFLLPELCLMTGIPDDFDQFRRKKISQNTIKSADEKRSQIQKLMKQLRGNDEFCELKQLGIEISGSLSSIKGRIIPTPMINLGQQCSVERGKQAFFNLFSKPIYQSKHSLKCGLIYFSSTQQIRQLLDIFQSTAQKLKVKFQIVKQNAGQYDSRRGLTSIEDMIKRSVQKDQCNICLIVLPNQMKSQYKKLKNFALLKHKVICQMTTQGTLRKKGLASIATKILLQMIAKRGNTLWVPKCPSGLSGTMLMAFESAKGGKKTTLSMCATINSTFSSIFSRTTTFTDPSQRFNAMISLSLQATQAYTHRNKQPPKEVIVLHKSTSGDQMVSFIDLFIGPLKNKLDEVHHEKCPLLTMVMINVKSSQRFFTSGGNRAENVPAGTLVSTEIVSKNYDFFVVSQQSNRGSTVPNHYKVIYSDSKIQEGVLQELVFGQCFNYVNWTGSIKVPGILQYADRCAKFNSEVLQNEELCEDLQNKLYFV